MFFSRAYEERVMCGDDTTAKRCHMGVDKCAYVQDLHSDTPGPVIYALKCVLCNRKYGPGYYSSIDEYSKDSMEKSLLGFKVRYNVLDYDLVDRHVVQCIQKIFMVLDCVHTMYSCDWLGIEKLEWFIRVCTGSKCSNKFKRNKTNVLTNLTYRSVGDISKSTFRYYGSSDITCKSCCSPTTSIFSNEYGYVIVEQNIYVKCSMCCSPATYNGEYIIGAVCNGCELECRSLYNRFKNCCRICGKKVNGEGYCRKHLDQIPN